MLAFTVSSDCKCLGCRGTPWERVFGISESVQTCGSPGPSLMFSRLSCPIFISGMRGLPAVRRVTVGGSVASRFPSLCLLSCSVCHRQEIHGLSSFPWVNRHGRLHASETRGLCARHNPCIWHNPGIIHKANWVSIIATVNN